ncbi:MAG: hypothetical protein R3C44_17980 [Chloroflexota bacterium]
MRPLTEDNLRAIARQTLEDAERGYGALNVQLSDDALDHLVDVANGDARGVLNALELAVETTTPDKNGVIAIDLAVVEESIQRRAVLYDKDGDVHYDTISAFIKSLRGSDPRCSPLLDGEDDLCRGGTRVSSFAGWRPLPGRISAWPTPARWAL